MKLKLADIKSQFIRARERQNAKKERKNAQLIDLRQYSEFYRIIESSIKGQKLDTMGFSSYATLVANYTEYCLGYIEPKLEKLRQEQRLKVGRKVITINGALYQYEGEMIDMFAHG